MQRLDNYCSKILSSRTKAQEAIALGCVSVNGKKVYRNATLLESSDEIHIDTQGLLVGRAGYKLRSFVKRLEEAHLWEQNHLHNKRVCDIGSSTGGFAQVLLECGVREVVCVDVGTNQLHASVREDSRVRVFEQCDARDFNDEIGFDLLLCDVSFISLYKLVESFKRISSKEYIWLFKPQFEVGKHIERDKKGVIKDKNIGFKALEKFCFDVREDFNIIHTAQSDIAGKEGNIEFFIYAARRTDSGFGTGKI